MLDKIEIQTANSGFTITESSYSNNKIVDLDQLDKSVDKWQCDK